MLTTFLRKDLNSILGDESQLSCEQCSYADDDTPAVPENLLILEHALTILNRCLVFQIQAIISDKTDVLFLHSLLDQE